MESSTPSATTDHLARIRDNQRRSRARRKDYLHSLEDKFRKCEQQGVEASAEMQQAARRVLEENRRLRMMLESRGVSSQEIDAAQGGSAVVGLDSLLGKRRPCCASNRSQSDGEVPSTCSSGVAEPPSSIHQQDRALGLQMSANAHSKNLAPPSPKTRVWPVSSGFEVPGQSLRIPMSSHTTTDPSTQRATGMGNFSAAAERPDLVADNFEHPSRAVNEQQYFQPFEVENGLVDFRDLLTPEEEEQVIKSLSHNDAQLPTTENHGTKQPWDMWEA